jgi:probable non-F420 flavinoid oxidoreductase
VTVFGYHASHEQFPPSQLLALVRDAERAGFAAATASDHFHPWSDAHGQSGFTWSWLGAALQATSLPFGIVNAPGYRYHPAVVAQAAATLAEMFAGRFWIAVGSGELLNEHITGERWPPKPERNRRLRECVDVMRALWAGETVTHHGLVTVEDAKLYTLPESPPRIIGAALTAETARWLGGWADGLITASQPKQQLVRLLDAFREGGGDGKPLLLQVKLSHAATPEDALAGAHEQWRTVVFDSSVLADLRMPAQFDAVSQFVQPEEVGRFVRISTDLEQQTAWLHEDIELGFEEIYLHSVHRDQQRFIEDYGERVLPALRG